MTAAHTEAHAFEEVDQDVSVGDAIEEVPSREEEETDGDEYDAEESEFDPLQQMSQLLITEEGIPIADVLLGIKDALDKLGKIHYKIAQILEAKLA